VTISRTVSVCRDPDDDRILEAAANGNADLIVSGDKGLLAQSAFEGKPIVDPADYLRSWAKR
jgi:predicted nucleic acid-binding protein